MQRFFLLLLLSVYGCCFEYSEKAGELERELKISEQPSKAENRCVPVSCIYNNAELLLWRA